MLLKHDISCWVQQWHFENYTNFNYTNFCADFLVKFKCLDDGFCFASVLKKLAQKGIMHE